MSWRYAHRLKTWPEPFSAVWNGDKRFEIRTTADRKFEVGQVVLLEEWCPAAESYLGPCCVVRVQHVVDGLRWGVPEGMCVFGFRILCRLSRRWAA